VNPLLSLLGCLRVVSDIVSYVVSKAKPFFASFVLNKCQA